MILACVPPAWLRLFQGLAGAPTLFHLFWLPLFPLLWGLACARQVHSFGSNCLQAFSTSSFPMVVLFSDGRALPVQMRSQCLREWTCWRNYDQLPSLLPCRLSLLLLLPSPLPPFPFFLLLFLPSPVPSPIFSPPIFRGSTEGRRGVDPP